MIQFTFLGLNQGFWLVAFPLILICYGFKKLSAYLKYKEYEENTNRLPNEVIVLNLSKDEKEILNHLVKLSGEKNRDAYIRKCMKEN